MYFICTQYLVGAHFALITASIFHGMEVISSLKYVNLCTQYLVGAPLAQILASVRCGMEACGTAFLLKISHMGFRSGMLACQSSTVISWSAKHLEVVLAVWPGAKVLLEKEISISIKLVSRWKHKVLQNLLVDGSINFGLDKTQWTNTSRRHGTPNHHRLWKLHTRLQAAWILFLPTLPPESRLWFPNEKQHLLLSEKRTFDHWATVQFLFYLA